MGIIKAFKLGFDYLKYDEDGNVQDTQRAVNDVNLDISWLFWDIMVLENLLLQSI